jgi:hypothetical protein
VAAFRPVSGVRRASNAAVLIAAHEDEVPATATVTARPFVKLVIRNDVPTGNWSDSTPAVPGESTTARGCPEQTSLPATPDCAAGVSAPARAKAAPPMATTTVNTPTAGSQPFDERMCNTDLSVRPYGPQM